MGRIQKKYQKGAAATYISRKRALKKLQLTLKDFRRLCILKGIYPHEPRHRRKLNKGGLQNRIWYYAKDINFLAHEPIINKLRDYKIFLRKLKRATSKKEFDAADRLRKNKPKYTLDHVIKERYPTFVDAVRDLDDSLCMIFLFARLPHSRKLPTTITNMCRRLSLEFLHYVIAARALRKVFVSIKGVYYQADILGNVVTWIVPHDRCIQQITDVDFEVMVTFVEFYVTMLGFINFKLYHNLGLHYPPKVDTVSFDDNKMYDYDQEAANERVYALSQSLQRMIDIGSADEETTPDEFPSDLTDSEQLAKLRNEQQKIKNLQSLFNNKKIFLSREVPRESLAFLISIMGYCFSCLYERHAQFLLPVVQIKKLV